MTRKMNLVTFFATISIASEQILSFGKFRASYFKHTKDTKIDQVQLSNIEGLKSTSRYAATTCYVATESSRQARSWNPSR